VSPSILLGLFMGKNTSYYIVIAVENLWDKIYYVFGSFHVLCLVRRYVDLHANSKERKSWYDAMYKYMATQHLDRSNKLNKWSSYILRESTDSYFLNLKKLYEFKMCAACRSTLRESHDTRVKKNCICKQQSSLQNTHQLNQRELRRIWEHNSIALGTEITSSTSEKGELKKYKLQQGRLANVLSLRQVASKIKITLKSNQRVIWIRIVIDLTLVQTTLRTREFARGYIAGRLQYLTTCRQQKPKRLCRAIS